MQLVTSLVRTYESQDAYEQDAARLARLGYVVAIVVEEPAHSRWAQRLQTLFGSPPKRLIVTYSDNGPVSPL